MITSLFALIKVIIMGVVQGLSEFLPISSSAHLVFTSNLMQIVAHKPIEDPTSYDIVLSMMLHIGTLVAVLIFFKEEVINIFNKTMNAIKTKDFSDYEAKLGLYIILGTFVTVIVPASALYIPYVEDLLEVIVPVFVTIPVPWLYIPYE